MNDIWYNDYHIMIMNFKKWFSLFFFFWSDWIKDIYKYVNNWIITISFSLIFKVYYLKYILGVWIGKSRFLSLDLNSMLWRKNHDIYLKSYTNTSCNTHDINFSPLFSFLSDQSLISNFENLEFHSIYHTFFYFFF